MARGAVRRIAALMDAGVLPTPERGGATKWRIAAAASRIVVEELCRLARVVPNKCRSGDAAIRAARMQAMYPSRLYHKAVVAWLAAANVLRVTHPYVLPDKLLGGGRPRLNFVNLPLVAWLAGVRKGQISWTARKASGAPYVASGGADGAKDATCQRDSP